MCYLDNDLPVRGFNAVPQPSPLHYYCLPQSLTFKGKMTTSLKFKEKATDLDTRSYKCLLLALVKLIHADPKLMLHVSQSNVV